MAEELSSKTPPSDPHTPRPLDPKHEAEHPIFHGPGNHKGKDDHSSAMKEVGPYITLGFQLAMFIGIGVAIGWYLDKDTDSSFWTGILAGAGAVMGMIYFLVAVTKLEKKKK